MLRKLNSINAKKGLEWDQEEGWLRFWDFLYYFVFQIIAFRIEIFILILLLASLSFFLFHEVENGEKQHAVFI